MRRCLVWVETHHFSSATVQIRRLTIRAFIAWCDVRSVTRGDQVTRDMLERFQRHLYLFLRRVVLFHRKSDQREALTWLDKYRAEARPRLAVDPSVSLVFLTCHGRPSHGNHVSQLVRGYLVRAGVTKCGSCQLFRHTVATLIVV